jgi:hypothetical protein
LAAVDHDPLDLDGQREREQKVGSDRKLARQVETEDMAWLMDNKRGRRIVWRLLERAGVYRTSFVAQSNSQTAFNEGMRNFGLFLLSEAAVASPDSFAIMQRENTKASK